jgi:hypothetical protein
MIDFYAGARNVVSSLALVKGVAPKFSQYTSNWIQGISYDLTLSINIINGHHKHSASKMSAY